MVDIGVENVQQNGIIVRNVWRVIVQDVCQAILSWKMTVFPHAQLATMLTSLHFLCVRTAPEIVSHAQLNKNALNVQQATFYTTVNALQTAPQQSITTA